MHARRLTQHIMVFPCVTGTKKLCSWALNGCCRTSAMESGVGVYNTKKSFGDQTGLSSRRTRCDTSEDLVK